MSGIQVTRNPNRGTELGYAESTTTFSQASAVQNQDYDVTGLSVTVTVGSRPINVRAYLPTLTNSGASLNLTVALYEGATQLQATSKLAPATAGGGAGDAKPEVRLNPSAGSHTYKVTIRTASAGAPTISSVVPTGTAAFIQVVEV